MWSKFSSISERTARSCILFFSFLATGEDNLFYRSAELSVSLMDMSLEECRPTRSLNRGSKSLTRLIKAICSVTGTRVFRNQGSGHEI